MKQRAAVGLSGGVDSAVSAYLLGKQGYEVTAVHLVCWDEGPKCRARADRLDAVRVALKLMIPLVVLDFQQEYKEKVIDRFYADYGRGLTPNPDVWCNSEIKFGLFLDWAMKQGFDYVATGHYARKVGNRLLIPKDKKKDQTYFLYQLKPEQLGKAMFPLGDYLKAEVREAARKAKLPVAAKKDSQGICFVGDVDVNEFLRRRLKEKQGEVMDTRGRVIGWHRGVWFYTIGQRGGWEIGSEHQQKFGGELPVFYVMEKQVKQNRLVVGFGGETYKYGFRVRDLQWIKQPVKSGLRVRLRHGGELIKASLQGAGVELDEAQRGVAPGQAAVFYAKNECLGGGTIA